MRFAAAFSLIAFFLWIVPLGVAIPASKESKVCGGKRAMHMCTMSKPSASKKLYPGLSLTAASQPGSAEKSSSGTGDDLWASAGAPAAFAAASAYFARSAAVRSAVFPRALFRPPSA